MALLCDRGKGQDAETVQRGELRIIKLQGSQLNDEQAKVVAKFLQGNTTVLQVCFLDNYIGPRGAKHIAKMLKKNRTLWFIHIGSNQIGDEGANALIEALNCNVCLKNMYVNGNEISSAALSATISYLTQTRNAILIPNAVRQASYFIIATHRFAAPDDLSFFATLPLEIVDMIAREVFATRKDPEWIRAVSDVAHMRRQEEWVKEWVYLNGADDIRI